MQPRLDLLTIAVDDLGAARRFYVEGLGWPVTLDVPGEILFVQIGHGLLAGFFGSADLAADLGTGTVVPGQGFTLAHNVGSAEQVQEVLDAAVAAGGTVLKPAQDAAFGGHHAYFADPCGVRWEVAWNPGLTFDADGTPRFAAPD
ncbi:MAG: glyoxalase [Frankiales bacterium]|nr:glyoxalase [Frankiales bacterium]